jgi:hypothetical protein
MRKLALCFALAVLVPAFAAAAGVQQANKPADPGSRPETAAAPAHFYRLDFVLKELDATGKPTNSRSFSTIVSTAGARAGSFSVGTKVPIVTGTQSSKDNPDAIQFQYIDVGVKIEARNVHEDGRHLAFYLKAELSSMAEPKVIGGVSEPVLHQNVWDGDVLIPFGKPTVAFQSDSLDSKGSMQIEVTASPVE